MGGGQIKFVYASPFCWGKLETHIKIPRKPQENAGTVPGQSWDNPGTIPRYFYLCISCFQCCSLALVVFQPTLLREVPEYTRSMCAPSCELWRTLANFGEPTSHMHENLPDRVPVKVPHI